MNIKSQQEEQYTVNPKKFMMWVFIVAICMLFAGLTSAYIVKKADQKNWIDFRLPAMFMYTTLIVLASSATLWWAARSAQKDEIGKVKIGIVATLVLGILFCLGQWDGWSDMVSRKIVFSGDSVSFSFVYILSGLHLVHIVGGVILMAALTVKAFRYKIHKKSMLGIQLASTYWHFLTILWVYLYVFLVNA
ncbi:MAG: heme-copper oxidase subunit III [Flavobacteriaceae bacterium]|nr:heme-copper oxidase subunit III [Flavobacteriaceae bacterium]